VAACSPYGTFPTTRGWPEKQRYGDLPEYSMAEGSDIQQFASFDEEARMLIEGGETAKRLPSATSQWFLRTSKEIDQLIAEARALIPDDLDREFVSTVTDLGILSNLALYHSRRIPAAVSYRIFVRTGDPDALDDAIAYESGAIEAWSQIVQAAGDVYTSDLKMGVREAGYMRMTHHLSGHWKDELGYLGEGLEQLKALRKTLQDTTRTGKAPVYKAAPSASNRERFQIRHEAVHSAPAGEDISIRAQVQAEAGVRWVRLRYRAVNQYLDYRTLPMEKGPEEDSFQAVVPAGQIDPQYDFMYFLEVMDHEGHGMIYPDLELETPYVIVRLERN
jgi:hypothetical protein